MDENLKSIETQRTGESPKAKFARFHVLVSNETERCTNNARTGNNEEMSASRNVFRRLGREADIWDMLNRKRYQGHSQHSTFQIRQQEVSSQGLRNIPIEDLRRTIISMEEHDEELIAEATGSPFCREICEARLLKGFKLYTIKVYEGKSDPQNHLDHFNDLMELHLVFDMAKCRVLVVTLTSGAKK